MKRLLPPAVVVVVCLTPGCGRRASSELAPPVESYCERMLAGALQQLRAEGQTTQVSRMTADSRAAASPFIAQGVSFCASVRRDRKRADALVAEFQAHLQSFRETQDAAAAGLKLQQMIETLTEIGKLPMRD